MLETKKHSYQNTVISLIFKYYLRNIQFEHYSQQPSNHQKSDFLTSYKNYMYLLYLQSIDMKYSNEVMKKTFANGFYSFFFPSLTCI